MKQNQNCTTCQYLDKSRKKSYAKCHLYGCNSPKRDGWMPCWINTDRLLEDVTCTTYWFPIVREVRQMTIKDYIREE